MGLKLAFPRTVLPQLLCEFTVTETICFRWYCVMFKRRKECGEVDTSKCDYMWWELEWHKCPMAAATNEFMMVNLDKT